MAHEIDMNNNRANFAYREAGGAPWHSLGFPILEDQPLELWMEAAGMGWTAETVPALYYDPVSDEVERFEGRKIILRSDTRQPLSMVSEGYQVVQPRDCIEFLRDLIESGGYRMETAGCLFGGKRFFATAKIDQSLTLSGRDYIEGYVLFATSLDASMATTGMVTSLRTVCNNTLTANIRAGENNRSPYIKIPHNTQFDPQWMKEQLGLVEGSWSQFSDEVTQLTARKVTDEEAMQWLVTVIGDPNKSMDDQPNQQAMKKVIQLFKGEGRGSDLVSANGTAWGLVNALTEFADHHRNTKTADSRFNNAQFGEWAKIKATGYDEALKLAA